MRGLSYVDDHLFGAGGDDELNGGADDHILEGMIC